MSNKLFQQNLDDKKGPQPGGPYLIQMLFKEPVDMPDKEKMTAVMGKHIGSAECFCYDKKMAGFAALDHIAEFQDGKCPVQLMVMKCDKFKGKGFDAFLMSQMWDCQEAGRALRHLPGPAGPQPAAHSGLQMSLLRGGGQGRAAHARIFVRRVQRSLCRGEAGP